LLLQIKSWKLKFETYKKRYSIFFSFRFYRFTEISFRFVSVSQAFRFVPFRFMTLSFSFRSVSFRFRHFSVFSVSFRFTNSEKLWKNAMLCFGLRYRTTSSHNFEIINIFPNPWQLIITSIGSKIYWRTLFISKQPQWKYYKIFLKIILMVPRKRVVNLKTRFSGNAFELLNFELFFFSYANYNTNIFCMKNQGIQKRF
jgi:hypothetical protein